MESHKNSMVPVTTNQGYTAKSGQLAARSPLGSSDLAQWSSGDVSNLGAGGIL